MAYISIGFGGGGVQRANIHMGNEVSKHDYDLTVTLFGQTEHRVSL